jgi:hypothetical protein
LELLPALDLALDVGVVLDCLLEAITDPDALFAKRLVQCVNRASCRATVPADSRARG